MDGPYKFKRLVCSVCGKQLDWWYPNFAAYYRMNWEDIRIPKWVPAEWVKEEKERFLKDKKNWEERHANTVDNT